MRPGELVALDTDTIGCYGYYSDFSRTFRCGPGKPTAYQKMLYRMSYDQVQHNIGIIAPGMAFREIAEKAWKIPANASSISATLRSCTGWACMARRHSSPMPWTLRPMAAKASWCPAWW